jgi:hypothetical protein
MDRHQRPRQNGGVVDQHQDLRQHNDVLLEPFLRATEAEESERLLSTLISEQARPLIKQIVTSEWRGCQGSASGLRPEDAEDVCAEAEARLFKRLRALRAGANETSIVNLRSYVAGVARNAWDQHLRSVYPQRARLKNKLRYLLGHRSSFALWQKETQEWVCGFATWKARKADSFDYARLHELMIDPGPMVEVSSNEAPWRMELEDLLNAIFHSVNCPVGLNQLVAIVGDLKGIRDHQPVSPSRGDEGQDPWESLPDPRVDVGGQLEGRNQLLWLWAEICQLPLRQRTALLLNLRDEQGQELISQFPHTGVATLRELATALALAAEQFAELYNRLPLDDATIAQRLGITRQQVINLRKAARDRLVRRMRSHNRKL